jgi:hypothetical protein
MDASGCGDCAGRSVIDLRPAAHSVRGQAVDYLEVVGDGRPLDHPPIPVALPTTAGTGRRPKRGYFSAGTGPES